MFTALETRSTSVSSTCSLKAGSLTTTATEALSMMGSPFSIWVRIYLYNLIMPTSAERPQSAGEAPEKRDPLPGHVGARLRPAKELLLVNLAELLVADRLDAVFEKFHCCRCDKCKKDVAAIALNSLPAHYVVAEPEALPGLLAQCQTREVSSALVRAVLQVKNHPRH